MKINKADVAELVDARDLKSLGPFDFVDDGSKTQPLQTRETAGKPSDLQNTVSVPQRVQRYHPGDAYFVRLVSDIYRALPTMPKPARPFAYNLIELLQNDVMSGPVWGDHPLQKPERLIMRQLEPFERAMRK